MIQYIIPLVASWLPVFLEYLVYFVAGSFVAFVGSFLHFLVRR